MKGGNIPFLIWGAGNVGTFVYLLSTDAPHFNFWNWVLFLPLDYVLSAIWPIFWLWHLLF